MRKKIVLGSIVFASLYLASYCVVRGNREVRFQNGGYRITSMNNSVFSDSSLFIFYKPLISADQLTMDSTELDNKPE
jgi:hypothetical protein